MARTDHKSWVDFLRKEGPEETNNSLKCAIAADLFLLHAVLCTDIDWCIARLKQVKQEKGNAERIIDIVLDAALPVVKRSTTEKNGAK